MLNELARRWAQGLTIGQISVDLGLTRGAVVGVIARAREHADDRFRSRPPKPKTTRVLKPIGETVGNSRALPPPPAPRETGPVPFLALRPGQCRFPLNSPERGPPLRRDGVLWGAVVRSCASYCSRHEAPRPARARAAKPTPAQAAERRLIAAMRDNSELTVVALANASNAGRSTTGERLRQLAKRGVVEKSATGRWRVKDDPPGLENHSSYSKQPGKNNCADGRRDARVRRQFHPVPARPRRDQH